MKKKILLVCLLVIGLIALGGYYFLNSSKTPVSSTQEETVSNVNKEKEECLSKGGEWKAAGLALSEKCFLKMQDANKDCSSSDECEGTCLALEGAEPGDKVVGKCSEYDSTFGCHSKVEDGKATPVLCID